MFHRKQAHQSHKYTGILPFKPIGTSLNIHDKDNNELHCGDKVSMYNGYYTGRLFLMINPRKQTTYIILCLEGSLHYHPYDDFNPYSYGKSVRIPADDGCKSDLILCGS